MILAPDIQSSAISVQPNSVLALYYSSPKFLNYRADDEAAQRPRSQDRSGCFGDDGIRQAQQNAKE